MPMHYFVPRYKIVYTTCVVVFIMLHIFIVVLLYCIFFVVVLLYILLFVYYT